MRTSIPPITALSFAVLILPVQAQDGAPGAPVRESGPNVERFADARPAGDTLPIHVTDIPRAADEPLTFPTPDDPRRPVMVLSGRLEERMRAMTARSPTFAKALQTLRDRRIPLLVGSIAQVEEALPTLSRYEFDGAGATWILSDSRGRPVAAAVTINLPKLVIRNRVLGSGPEQLRRMMELHLAHEIYGHVVPVVVAGELDHPCRFDPEPNAPPAVQRRSCVMQREAEVLTDLGYEPRESYRWDYWEAEIVPSDG